MDFIRILDEISSLENNINWLYSETIGIFLVLFILMFALNVRNWQFRPINYLSVLYVLVTIVALADIAWKFIDGIPDLRALNRGLQLIYTILYPIIGWLWLANCLENGKAERKMRIWLLSVCAVPVIAEIFLAILSLKYGIVFYVGDDGIYHRGDFTFLVPGVCFLNLGITSLLELFFAYKANLLIEKKKHLVAAAFAIPVFVFAIIQNVLPVGIIPASYFGILFAVIFTYIQSIRDQITRDPTTNVNNRYTIDRILEEAIHRQEKGTDNLLWLIVCDLNDFKNINDTYGHVTGDQALSIVGEALIQVTSSMKASVGRIGGDEFFIVIESKDSVVPRTIVTALPKTLREMSKNKEFKLSTSLGVCLYEKGMTRGEFIKKADERMYAIKRNYHQQSNRI